MISLNAISHILDNEDRSKTTVNLPKNRHLPRRPIHGECIAQGWASNNIKQMYLDSLLSHIRVASFAS